MSGAPEEEKCEICEGCDCAAVAPLWMATFGDLMSLLLTFFVLLLSFSTTDPARFRELAGSVENSFGVDRRTPINEPPLGTSVIFSEFNNQDSQSRVTKQMLGVIKDFAVRKTVVDWDLEVFKDYRGVILRVNGSKIFKPFGTEIQKVAHGLLDDIFYITQSKFDAKILVEGHCAKVPFPRKTRFRSFRDLTALRSVNVVEYFLKMLQDKSQSERYFADSRGATVQIADNDTPEGRKKNDRIEFVFSVRQKKEEVPLPEDY